VVAGSFWATVGLFASAAPEVEESKRRAFTVRDHGGEASTTSVTAAQDLIRGTAYNAAVVPGVENTTMQQLQLVSFVLAMAALVVCGCIFTRKPRKILPKIPCGQRCRTNISPVVLLSKKKGAVIGQAAAYR